jgi:hypothetical protein
MVGGCTEGTTPGRTHCSQATPSVPNEELVGTHVQKDVFTRCLDHHGAATSSCSNRLVNVSRRLLAKVLEFAVEANVPARLLTGEESGVKRMEESECELVVKADRCDYRQVKRVE